MLSASKIYNMFVNLRLKPSCSMRPEKSHKRDRFILDEDLHELILSIDASESEQNIFHRFGNDYFYLI